jgi:hypothetical protein
MKQILLARSLQGSIKHHLPFALLILLQITVLGQAQEAEAEKGKSSEIAYGFETDFNSRYVFRGLAYSQGPVNQSTAWMAVSGFTLYAWGNFVLNREPHQGEFTEMDFGVSYKREWKKLSVEPTFDYYLYRTPAPVKDPPTGEVSLKLTYQIGPAHAFTKQTFDIGRYRGAYLGEAGLAYEHKLNRKTTLATTFSLSWASAKFNEAYAGVPKRAFNLVGAEVSISYAPSRRFYLRPHFELTRIVDGHLRRQLNSPTIGNFGLAFGLNLSAVR